MVSAILRARKHGDAPALVAHAVCVIEAGSSELVAGITHALAQSPEYWGTTDQIELADIGRAFALAIKTLVQSPPALAAFVHMFAAAFRCMREKPVFVVEVSAAAGYMLASTDEAWAALDAAEWLPPRAEFFSRLHRVLGCCEKLSRAIVRLALTRDELRSLLASALSVDSDLGVLELLRDRYAFAWADFSAASNIRTAFKTRPELLGFYQSIGAPREFLIAKSVSALERMAGCRQDHLDKSDELVVFVYALDAAGLLAEIPQTTLVTVVRALLIGYNSTVAATRILDLLAPDCAKEIRTVIRYASESNTWTAALDRCVDAAAFTPKTAKVFALSCNLGSCTRAFARACANAWRSQALADQFAALLQDSGDKDVADFSAIYSWIPEDPRCSTAQSKLLSIARLPSAAFAVVAARLADPASTVDQRAAVLCYCVTENLDNARALCLALEAKNLLAPVWGNFALLQTLSANSAAARAVFAPTSSWPGGFLARDAGGLVCMLRVEVGFCAHLGGDAAQILITFGRLACENPGKPIKDAALKLNAAWCDLGFVAAVLAARGYPDATAVAASAFEHAGAAGRQQFWCSRRFAEAVAGPASLAANEVAASRGLAAAVGAHAPACRQLLRAALESGRDETFAALEAAGIDVAAGLAAHAPALKAFAACMRRSGYSLEKRLQARLVGAGVLETCCATQRSEAPPPA